MTVASSRLPENTHGTKQSLLSSDKRQPRGPYYNTPILTLRTGRLLSTIERFRPQRGTVGSRRVRDPNGPGNKQ